MSDTKKEFEISPDPEYIELNLDNCDVEDIDQLNQWGIWAYAKLESQAAEIEELRKDRDEWKRQFEMTRFDRDRWMKIANERPVPRSDTEDKAKLESQANEIAELQRRIDFLEEACKSHQGHISELQDMLEQKQ